jgi:hypothetical protein
MTIHANAWPCLTRVCAVDIAFAEHLDLLDLHGRAAVASLAQLAPDDTLPPRATSVHDAAREHWATLEVWAWSLEHPGHHWSERPEAVAPAAHPLVVAAIADELTRLEELLLATGPDTAIDYFGRPGTTAEVARLLAHEAIDMAHAASLAAGRATPALHPAAAADVIDRTLDHWAEPDAGVAWQPRPALLHATDAGTTGTGRSWSVAFGRHRRGGGAIRTGTGEEPCVVVQGPATAVLWWLHGHRVDDEVDVSGAPDVVRALRDALDHEVAPVPRRRGWWRG